MEFYHTTTVERYENYIKIEGLKPICLPELKNFPACHNVIHLLSDLKDAIEFGIVSFEGKKEWLILEINIGDILDTCKCLSKEEFWSINEYIATSIFESPKDPKKIIVDFSDLYPCVIPANKLKVIYRSNKKA